MQAALTSSVAASALPPRSPVADVVVEQPESMNAVVVLPRLAHVCPALMACACAGMTRRLVPWVMSRVCMIQSRAFFQRRIRVREVRSAEWSMVVTL